VTKFGANTKLCATFTPPTRQPNREVLTSRKGVCGIFSISLRYGARTHTHTHTHTHIYIYIYIYLRQIWQVFTFPVRSVDLLSCQQCLQIHRRVYRQHTYWKIPSFWLNLVWVYLYWWVDNWIRSTRACVQ